MKRIFKKNIEQNEFLRKISTKTDACKRGL